MYISTNLGIESAIDNVDRDYIEVVLNDNMEVIIISIKQLGFSLKTVECEYVNSNRYFQEFEFEHSYNSEFRRKLDELELVMKPNSNGIDIHLEV